MRLLHLPGPVADPGVPVHIAEPQRIGPSGGVAAASAMIRSAALPAAASSPSLRRIVLTSGARSQPSTRPSPAAEPGCRPRPAAPRPAPATPASAASRSALEPVLELAVDLASAASRPVSSSAGSASSSPASGYRAPGRTPRGALAQQPPPRQHPLRITRTGPAAPNRRALTLFTVSGVQTGALPGGNAGRRGCPPDATRPSALRTVNVYTPVAAAISRSVAPAASSPAIRSASSCVSF